MSNQEWDALAAQWDGMEVGDPAILQRRLRRHVRWNRLGLFGEAFSVLFVLGLVAYIWNGAADIRGWLIAAALVVVVCQGIYLMLRHHYRLFGAPDAGLVGLIDAEIRRAQFVIATHGAGAALGLLLLPVAWLLIPGDDYAPAIRAGLIGGAVYLAYTIPRSWQLLRSIRRLREERAALAE